MRLLILLACLCGHIFTLPAQAADRPLRLGMEHWPPYLDRYHENHGAAAELVMTALSRAGYDYTFSYDNWSHTLQGTEIGVLDIVVAGWYTDERAQQFVYSEPYLYNRISFIKRKNDSVDYTSMEDLRGEVIGIVSNYAYGPEFDGSNLLIKLPNNHLIQNLSLLQQGKLDLTLDDELVIRHQLRTFMPGTSEQFAFLTKPVSIRGLHILVSRRHQNHEQIVSAFNQALKQMKEDGSYQSILEKYQDGFTFRTQP